MFLPELIGKIGLRCQGLEVHVALLLLRALLIAGRVVALRKGSLPDRGLNLLPRRPGDSHSGRYKISQHFGQKYSYLI